MMGESLFYGVKNDCDIGICGNFILFELDSLFRSKPRRIFELNPYSDEVAMQKKVQLAVNSGLKTLQTVQFVLNTSSISSHIVATVYDDIFIVLTYSATFSY